MERKIRLSKKPISTILKVSFSIATIAVSFILIGIFKTKAQDIEQVSTIVTIGNASPIFTEGPAENPATTATDPISSGGVVTFSAKATDSNGQAYFLTVCATNQITAPSGTGPGTCVGENNTYCSTSSATASGTGTSCTYTTGASNIFSNPWYAFVCDNDSTDPKCSVGASGTGDSGSPLFVNHRPVFSSISNTGNINPGETITWNATANNPDFVEDNSLRIKLLVCKTNSITTGANPTCSGGSWCTSTDAKSNPSCQYTAPTVAPDINNNAYVFVVNNFGTPASGGAQGQNSSFYINNVAPTVTNVTINGGSAITLAESTTKPVIITASVTDKNGCDTTEIATVNAYAYRGGATPATSLSNCIAAGASNDKDKCYNSISCTQVGGSCNAGTANYTCTANFEYYADPTDTGTEFPSESWYSSVKATDDDSANDTTTVTTGVKVNSLIAFSVTTLIDYGALSPNDKINLTRPLTTTPTGNVGLDQSHKGTAMCTDYSTNPTCASGGGKTPIAVSEQRYSLTSGAEYDDGTPLSTIASEIEINVPKVRNGTVLTKNTYWGINIPNGILAGIYNGLNTITAIKGETANW